MADVIPESDGRGQLILITGVAIAVVLVAMVLLLNTVIYTENLATRSVGSDAGDALEYRAVVVGSVGGLIDAENAQEYETYDEEGEDNVTSPVRSGMKTIDDRLIAKHAERGAIVGMDVDNAEFTEGLLLRQNETGPFTSDGTDTGDANWTLVDNVNNTRGYVVELDAENVSKPTDPGEDAFSVNATDGNNHWLVYVYKNESGILVQSGWDGETEPVCFSNSTSGTVTLDLTGETIDGQSCEGPVWPADFDQYQIMYENGDAAAGTYDLTVKTENGEDDLEDIQELVDLGEDATVYAVPAVYSATVDVEYRSSEVHFETRVRIARGEPDG